MTPVAQTKLYGADGIHNGNCFAACLASLLDLPLWMVPPFEDMFGRSDSALGRVDTWLGRMFDARLVRNHGHEFGRLPEFYIANGPAARGVYHSVIYRAGTLAHDPHPGTAGIMAVEWTWHVAPLPLEDFHDRRG